MSDGVQPIAYAGRFTPAANAFAPRLSRLAVIVGFLGVLSCPLLVGAVGFAFTEYIRISRTERVFLVILVLPVIVFGAGIVSLVRISKARGKLLGTVWAMIGTVLSGVWISCLVLLLYLFNSY